jgi:hypothetical protein
MKITAPILFLFLFTGLRSAAQVTGLITDEKGNLLSYASVLVKGTGVGTTANDQGRFTLQLDPGKYVLVCQYVGYGREEKTINVSGAEQVVNFKLKVQQTTMKEFVVRPGGSCL